MSMNYFFQCKNQIRFIFISITWKTYIIYKIKTYEFKKWQVCIVVDNVLIKQSRLQGKIDKSSRNLHSL